MPEPVPQQVPRVGRTQLASAIATLRAPALAAAAVYCRGRVRDTACAATARTTGDRCAGRARSRAGRANGTTTRARAPSSSRSRASRSAIRTARSNRISALTQAWIAAQTERTQRALGVQQRDSAAEQRLTQLMSIGSLERRGGRRPAHAALAARRHSRSAGTVRGRRRQDAGHTADRPGAVRRARRTRLVLPVAERSLRRVRHLRQWRRALDLARIRPRARHAAARHDRAHQVVQPVLAERRQRLLLHALSAAGRTELRCRRSPTATSRACSSIASATTAARRARFQSERGSDLPSPAIGDTPNARASWSR